MKNSTMTFFGALVLLSVAGCTAAPTTLPPGEYKKTEKSVNEYGTTTTKETTTDVYYDRYGNKRAVQETETTRDPKGMFNKEKSTTTRTYD